MDNRPRRVALAAAASLLAVVAGCAAGPNGRSATNARANADANANANANIAPALAHSAAVLKQNSWVFASRSQDETQRYSEDANVLQKEAYEFDNSVQSGRDVKTEFGRLSQAYQAVQSDVAQVDSTKARTDLQPVTQAYQNVQSDMQGYAGGSAAGE